MPLNYLSFLLRLWKANDGEQAWRASLESSQLKGVRGFPDLEALFSFLREQTGDETSPSRLDQDTEGGALEDHLKKKLDD